MNASGFDGFNHWHEDRGIDRLHCSLDCWIIIQVRATRKLQRRFEPSSNFQGQAKPTPPVPNLHSGCLCPLLSQSPL